MREWRGEKTGRDDRGSLEENVEAGEEREEEEEEEEVGGSKSVMALVFPLAVTRWDEGRHLYSSTGQTSGTRGSEVVWILHEPVRL